ncbi:MAG: DUF4159 domain-containing protein [Pseudomonadota bacterium]
MFGLPLAFTSPWILLGLISLPIIWWLLRLTPPRPQEETFPPTRILARLREKEETPAQSPWWLTLLRLMMAGLVILAMAGPVLNPEDSSLAGEGPVMIVIDDGWAAAKDWEDRRETALSIISEAGQAGRTVMLESTVGRETWTGLPMSAQEASALLLASDALPLRPVHNAISVPAGSNGENVIPGQINWLSDGLERPQTLSFVESLAQVSENLVLYRADTSNLSGVVDVQNNPSELIGTVVRAEATSATQMQVLALDENNLVLARSVVDFAPGELRQQFVFDQPVELRNQFTRLEIEGALSAGAVRLLDENNRRRLVGLISGAAFDQSQPLLSPLYYISKALEPFSDIRRSNDANVAASVPDLINQGVSVIIMADVGTLPDNSVNAVNDWIEKGGMLVRFAGPRLGASPDSELLPVEIRPGDRSLGGALSWETPKPLAAFDRDSPFAGIEPPRDVLIQKQLLALQESELDKKTWSRLEDGTPLVTAEQRGAGWLVLYHVGTDSDWSNLPLSGTFVEMLRRTVNLANSGSAGSSSDTEVVLPPLKLLDGQGKFAPPPEEAQALTITGDVVPKASLENPPGFYGTDDGVRALNLLDPETDLKTLDVAAFNAQFEQRVLVTGREIAFKSWLLLLAALLLLADCLAVLWMSGAFGRRFVSSGSRAATIWIMASLVVAGNVGDGKAQEVDFSAALQTKLAYVITGVDDVDRISEAGMRGLTRFISSRTALEPGEPVGLDMAVDELSFYSLIYWPIDPRAELPDDATMARVDAFMKQGGSILFDTRDQISGVLGGTSGSPAAQTLQLMLSSLDIPPLEPVPSDHVLTKAFYLLDDFPGRYNGGDLWVEVTQGRETDDGRPARAGDGVSSILITSNDFAGAWAVDSTLRPLLPTVPPDPAQRNYAFRSGVNLMMYALTGNYKADQVHLPALLERLGQ